MTNQIDHFAAVYAAQYRLTPEEAKVFAAAFERCLSVNDPITRQMSSSYVYGLCGLLLAQHRLTVAENHVIAGDLLSALTCSTDMERETYFSQLAERYEAANNVLNDVTDA